MYNTAVGRIKFLSSAGGFCENSLYDRPYTRQLELFLIKILRMQKEIKVNIEVLESADELDQSDADLLATAREVTKDAYAPYSKFHVGAAARMVNDELVTGTNQENAAFPAGICAERVLMSTASSLFPGVGIDTLAISYHNHNGSSSKPISPCGICRQSLLEFQSRTGHKIRLLLSGREGQVIILNDATDLLPLVFSAEDMK